MARGSGRDGRRERLGTRSRRIELSRSAQKDLRRISRCDGRLYERVTQTLGALEAGAIERVELRGVEAARPGAEVLEAISHARAIVIGPSNPVISIGPILAVPGVRDALLAAHAPVVAVSPLVHGDVLKGPTADFMTFAGRPLDSNGIAATYAGLLDGLVADERADGLPTLETDVAMPDAGARRRLARETLAFADGLGTRR